MIDILGTKHIIYQIKQILYRFRKSMLAYGIVVSMFDFHCSDRGSNPGHGGQMS